MMASFYWSVRMMKNSHSQSPSARRAVPVAVLILFATLPGFTGLAAPSFAQTNQIAGSSSNSLPSKIITTDGQTYNSAKLLRVLPDGLLVEYPLDSGGTGLARLKFATLPESLQKQFGYDQKKASAYEKAEKLAMAKLSRKLQRDEKIRTAALADIARSSVFVQTASPTVAYTYYDPAGPRPPGIVRRGGGNTSYHLKCDTDFTFRWRQKSADGPFNFHFETATISIGLAITITLPNGEAGKLKGYEEGHRKIDEHFYSVGPQAAQRAGELITGKEITSYEKDFESAKLDVLTRARDEVQAEYMKYTRDLCRQANKYYDDLTDYGRNSTDSDQAAQEAIRQYEPQLPN
jgi:hypothetical protein